MRVGEGEAVERVRAVAVGEVAAVVAVVLVNTLAGIAAKCQLRVGQLVGVALLRVQAAR